MAEDAMRTRGKNVMSRGRLGCNARAREDCFFVVAARSRRQSPSEVIVARIVITAADPHAIHTPATVRSHIRATKPEPQSTSDT